MSTNKEIDAHLDIIAEAAGQNGATAEQLNCIHSCRAGHPLNESTVRPFLNMRCMIDTFRAYIPHTQRAWIDAMVRNEHDRL